MLAGGPERIVSDDEKVEHGDAQQPSCLCQTIEDLVILRRRSHIARRVIVSADDGRGVGQDGCLEDLTWMHHRGAKGSDRYDLHGNNAVLAVEVHREEMLAVLARENASGMTHRGHREEDLLSFQWTLQLLDCDQTHARLT